MIKLFEENSESGNSTMSRYVNINDLTSRVYNHCDITNKFIII